MAKINANYNKLPEKYLFTEIAKKTRAFKALHPKVEILRLGIGDTTLPLVPSVVQGLLGGAKKLGNAKTYTGYGDEQGNIALRSTIAALYKKNGIKLDPDEVFVSDGAKTDCANIISIFAGDSIVALQDPAYPVYKDSSIIAGKKLVYMKAGRDNGFFPNVPKFKVDLIFLCSPNNPTGAVATKKQLKGFVDYALKNKAVIVFDAAYSTYVKDKTIPKSIYEIAGAKKCAVEIQSFSKSAGFTGVRLGWTIVPKDLICVGAVPGKLNKMWARRQTTMFNGASNIAQVGGLAVLSAKGQRETQKQVNYYMENAQLIKKGLEKIGLVCFGGENAPYIWLKVPGKMKSWEFFDKLLNDAHVVTTPGSGFGPAGEGYMRLSAFGRREDILKAVESVEKNLKL